MSSEIRINEYGQPIGHDVRGWHGAQYPQGVSLKGRYCRVEPLGMEHVLDLSRAFDLFEDQSWRTYLPLTEQEDLRDVFAFNVGKSDPLHYAIISAETGAAVGTVSLMRQRPELGTIEMGWVMYSPLLKRTPAATEAQYLLMKYVFEDLGYRRYEWKCDSLNAPSRQAAVRLGFREEGTFRNAMVYKGRSRDSTWFSITDDEWFGESGFDGVRAGFERWLDPRNFVDGKQVYSLRVMRAFTAMNCSIGQQDWKQAVANTPFDRVELWWPWDTAEPSDEQIDELVTVIRENNKSLVALNMYGGDLAVGERGVLHEQDYTPGWVEALEKIHDATGVRRFNLLLGRGGRGLSSHQRDSFVGLSGEVGVRFGGKALVEPLSALGDYPVKFVREARPLLSEHSGLLLDIYHLHANGLEWSEILGDLSEMDGSEDQPATIDHVQFADFPGRGLPGTGELDWVSMVADLREIGYAGDVVLECLPEVAE